MDILFFFTDRFPYGKGEAFIENEIPFLDDRFDRIYVIPTALTADTTISRPLSKKFIVLPPANVDDLYVNGRPAHIQRMIWTIKYMLPWCVKTLFAKDFWSEVGILYKTKQLRTDTIGAVIRVIAPALRNNKHFKSIFSTFNFLTSDRYYLYSYWFNNYPSSIEYLTGIKRQTLQVSVMRAHGIDLYAERHACHYIPLREKSFDALDRLVLISDNGYNYITERYPQYQKKCSVSRLGTKDYGIGPYNDQNPFVLVSCSSVIPVKRVHRIVDSLALIDEFQIHWIHFGGGQDYEQLKQYATNQLARRENITFDLKGQFLNKDLMAYYQEHPVSLFVNVSESEGLPVSVMEAISFGIPVVATNVGGTSEAFEEDSGGALLSKDFTDDELVSQIMRFVKMDRIEYTKKRQRTRKLWEERFDASHNYQHFISTYFK